MGAPSLPLKSLFATFVLSVALAGCGREDASGADSTSQIPGTETSAATGSSSAGDSSSGAGEASSGASAAGSASSQVIDDSVITTKAKTALLADTTVKGTDIGVETNQGVIVLSGAVEDAKQKQRAESIVRGLDGVKSVENKLTVEKQQ